ncbi:MAG: hypothetical protein SAK29_29960 [Scytonema sp. PMC 1069.18]|nr:hypothetical protein [Scytonema sp. PMC 1069.18]MEC4881601.1 hypothetical protein [Scytonema sp. PMC 1070.18]
MKEKIADFMELVDMNQSFDFDIEQYVEDSQTREDQKAEQNRVSGTLSDENEYVIYTNAFVEDFGKDGEGYYIDYTPYLQVADGQGLLIISKLPQGGLRITGKSRAEEKIEEIKRLVFEFLPDVDIKLAKFDIISIN